MWLLNSRLYILSTYDIVQNLKLEKDYLGWSCDINLNFPTAPCSRCCPAACEKRWTIILRPTCNWTSGYWLIWWVISFRMCKITSGNLNDRYRNNRWWTCFSTYCTHIFDTGIKISWFVFGSNGIWFLDIFSRFFRFSKANWWYTFSTTWRPCFQFLTLKWISKDLEFFQ